MRKGYWIILVFVFWCVVCAVWYMFSVKGLPDNTALIKPSTTTIAIVEILIMITVAFFMGFGLAWMMRTDPLEEATDKIRNASYEIRDLQTTVTTQHESIITWQTRTRDSDDKATVAQTTSEQLAIRLSDMALQEEILKKRVKEVEAKIQQTEADLNSSKFRIRMLEGDLEEKNKAVGKLKEELTEVVDNTPKVEHRDWSDHPFVKPMPEADLDEKDDLTEIKGIGPAFQKKLNSLDIFSFRQISELDGEGVERLAEIIEVFPDRIHRDNWTGQATRLYLKKIGKEI